jgi:hypothetical protein
MSTAREKLFRCTFRSRSHQRSWQVRAWDQREAALLFREALDEDGETTRGTIHVTDLDGRLDEQFDYQPGATA